MSDFLEPLVTSPSANHELVNATTGEVVARQIVGAFDSRTRRKGLLGKDRLPVAEALVLAPCEAVHTFFMRFPIDVAFISRDGVVVRVRRGLRPWRIAAALSAFATVETAAGTLARVTEGDRLVVR